MSNTSSEQTETARALLNTITSNVQTAVDNNLPHATKTTNAWKDAVFAIEQASKSLGLLLFQLQGFSQVDASGILARINARESLANAENTLGNMSLVFHTDMRWKALKKARDALKECSNTVRDIEAKGGSSSAAASAPAATGAKSGFTHSGMSNRDILNAPMPEIPRQTVEFKPSGGSELKTNADGTFEKPYLGKNIKPSQFMTFSSAESSASARLGVSGKCVLCNAVRDASSATCPSCGKAANIVFN